LERKGFLWWSIHKILSEKKNKPKYIFLENVDRLLISPSNQRGRDFAIILKSLNDLGYAVEWRVINAAEYGMPQRRRRIFILAYLQNSPVFNSLHEKPIDEWILNEGTISSAFPVSLAEDNALIKEFELEGDIVHISSNFNTGKIKNLFENTGVMINGVVSTVKTKPNYDGPYTLLKDIIHDFDIAEDFYINEKDLERWLYLKGPKREMRKNSQGFEYNYSEGGMIFPDPLDKASRTIITGEGGGSPSRFKHVIKTTNGYRRLSPIELERLNMFPDDHTKFNNISDSKRAFLMGNALVVGIIEKIGLSLTQKIKNEVTLQYK
jgi:DNA (cytosine-5)-methyltransferase 1